MIQLAANSKRDLFEYSWLLILQSFLPTAISINFVGQKLKPTRQDRKAMGFSWLNFHQKQKLEKQHYEKYGTWFFSLNDK